MTYVRTWVAIAVLQLGCATPQPAADRAPAPADPRPTVEPAATTAPLDLANDHVVVSITAQGGMPRIAPPGQEQPPRGPRTITSIRWDGQAQWSNDRRRGGEPLHSATVEVARLRSWIDELRRDGTFDDAALNRSNFGPDAAYIAIQIDIGAQTLNMASWHEVDDPSRAIATASGLQALDGRDPTEVMAAQPADYQHFIERWTAVRTAVDELLPASD